MKTNISFIIAILAATTALSSNSSATPFDPANYTPTLGADSVYDVSKFGFFASTKEDYETNKFVFYTADADGQISHTQLSNPTGTTINNANGNYFGHTKPIINIYRIYGSEFAYFTNN